MAAEGGRSLPPGRSPTGVQADETTGPTGRVKLMLTAAERERLAVLGYSEEEAALMRVELATAMLEKGMRRPWGEKAMPASWRCEAAVAAAEAAEDEGEEDEGGAAGGGGARGLVAVAVAVAFTVLCASVATSQLGAARPSSGGGGGALRMSSGDLPEYSLRSARPPKSELDLSLSLRAAVQELGA